MFRNVQLPRSRLVDISEGGAFTCINCHFSNVSTAEGIVDTGNNVNHGSNRYHHDYEQLEDIRLDETGDHSRYDITLYPAPEEAVVAYGTDYVVANETIRDCVYVQRWAGDHALPECPQESVAERRARLAPVSRSQTSDTESDRPYGFREEYAQQEGDRDLNRCTAADHYYDYISQMPWPEDAGPADAPSPLLDMSYAADFEPSLPVGKQLSIDHPWIQATMKVRISRKASFRF